MLPTAVRKLVVIWFFVSIAVVVVKAAPLLARFQSNGQELVDRELERRKPADPTIDLPADSPWPTTTIRMRGRAISGTNESIIPYASLSFTPVLSKLALTYDTVSLIDLHDAKQLRSMPSHGDQEKLWNGAISGDESVIATVGEHTLIKFWDAHSGLLIEAHEDNAPTLAAHPDLSPHSRKHTNKLRYSETGVRRVTAAPGGCLFAIGKIDGSIELWGPIDEPLPTTSHATQVHRKQVDHSMSHFKRLARSVPHLGEVLWLAFTADCQSVVSVSGHTVEKYEERELVPNAPKTMLRAASNKIQAQVIRTRVPTNEVMWKVPQTVIASALALDDMSQDPKWVDPQHPPRFALADYDRKVSIRHLETGELLQTIDTRTEGPAGMLSSVSFGNRDSYLWTIGTRYSGKVAGQSTSETAISAWDIPRGKRIATALLPGQLHAAEWSRYGVKLALLRYMAPTQPQGFQMPWELQPPSPFLFHLWDVSLTQMSRPSDRGEPSVESR